MRRPPDAEAAIEAFRQHLTAETQVKERTVNDYCATLGVAVRFLRANGRSCLPWEITREDIVWLISAMIDRGLKVSTRKSYVTPIKLWCSYYGNDGPAKLKIRWPHDVRPNADWLTDAQARSLLALEMAPFEELLVHCELCLGMRRIEVLRLTVHSFRDRYVDILGKGPQDGRPRVMPFHRDTHRVLSRYLEYRKALVSVAVSRRSAAAVPEVLLIYLKGHTLRTYSEKGSGLDAWLKDLGGRIGYSDLSNHTLRRTFGRTMWKCDVKPAVIAEMMGIEDEKTLKGYLGINMDDMTDAMAVYSL